MQKLIYSALFLVSVFAAFWAFLPNNKVAIYESNNLEPKPSLASDTPVSPTKSDQTPASFEITEVDDSYCRDLCLENMELLRLPTILTDEEYEELLGRTEELALYLRQHPEAREEFLELANTEDGDKRSVIMAVFDQLDLNARMLLGERLIESSDWHSRFDGVSFLAQPDIMDDQLVKQFSDMLAADSDSYVRSSIIKAFNQPEKFYGNQDILSTLEQVGYSDSDNTVRGEALLARVQLEQEPEKVVHDALSAIRSDDEDNQYYGLRALYALLNRQSEENTQMSLINEEATREMLSEFVGPKYDNAADLISNEARAIYNQYF